MFPITDLSRADDIRMRRRRAVGLLAGIALVLAAFGHRSEEAARAPVDRSVMTEPSRPTHDHAAMSAEGDSLLVTLPCAGSVAIVPRRALSRRVLVSTTGDNDVQLAGGRTIRLNGACSGGDVRIEAPPGMALALVATGATDVHIGDFTGPVTLTQHGGGDVVIGSAGRLEGEIAGSGDLSINDLHGDLHLRMAGNGDLRIASIQASSVALTAFGSSDISILSGRIGKLSAELRGSGDLAVDAETGDASVEAGEANDVSLPHVTGRLVRNGVAQAAASP